MSLNVPDHRSGRRSKSRERSRSRSRAPSASPREKSEKSRKYYDQDPADEYGRSYTAPRSSRHADYYSGREDDGLRPAKPSRDRSRTGRRYYVEEDEAVPQPSSSSKYPTSARSSREKVARYPYSSESDHESAAAARASQKLYPGASSGYASRHADYFTDSEDDDGLAYGDDGYEFEYPASEAPRSRSRSRSRSRGRLQAHPDRYHYEADSGHGYPKHSQRYSTSRTKEAAAAQYQQNQYDQELQSAKYPSIQRPSASEIEALKLQQYATSPTGTVPSASDIDLNAWAEVPECERPGYVPPPSLAAKIAWQQANIPQSPTAAPYPQPIPNIAPGGSTVTSPTAGAQYPTIPPSGYSQQPYAQNPINAANIPPPEDLTRGHHRTYSTPHAPTSQQNVAQPHAYQYATPEQLMHLSKSGTQTKPKETEKKTAQPSPKPSRIDITPKYVDITPKKSRSHSHSLSTPDSQLKIPGSFPDSALPPPSPLLAPYHGTYQSVSPMPWPTTVPSDMDEGLSDLEPLDESRSLIRRKSKRDKSQRREKSRERPRPEKKGKPVSEKASVGSLTQQLKEQFSVAYDAKADAKSMRSALSHLRLDPKPIMTILPYLTSDEILELRSEYKNYVQINKKGVNLAKHIKSRIKGHFGKVCYTTALGRWESEAHWANYWYQSNNSRRELLIESLIGRSNSEIRLIKECFRDKRYDNDLEKCMKSELDANKFQIAILLALQGKRQSETTSLDADLLNRDVHDLHRALVSRTGGETAMIHIFITRSNKHIREILFLYERVYRQNFGKALMTKSQNLVGEVLAHAINGALNRPQRDAILLHHAIAESAPGRNRAELLISRLVRMHWEPLHLEKTKYEYHKRYGKYVEDHIEEQVIGDAKSEMRCEWAEFCVELAKSSSVHVETAMAR